MIWSVPNEGRPVVHTETQRYTQDIHVLRAMFSDCNVEDVGLFSAVCWLYGKHLYDKYQRPIGLVQSAWGGTRIEAWSSPAALDVCFPGGTQK